MQQPSVLLVEDDAFQRKAAETYLTNHDLKVIAVENGAQMRRQISRAMPDLVLLDVQLPGQEDGFSLARWLRESNTRVGIIMLTALGDSDDRIRGFESGADIYLVKHSTLREIEAAIRSLLRRSGNQPGTANGNGDQWQLDGTNWMLVAPNLRSLKLTATEFAFMSALCNRGGNICQREDLMETLARPRSTFSNRHLDAIVSRLRRKIEERTSLPAPIKVVYGVGYTFTATAAIR